MLSDPYNQRNWLLRKCRIRQGRCRHSRSLLQGCQRIRTRRSRLVRCTRHRHRVLRHMGRCRRRCHRRPHRPTAFTSRVAITVRILRADASSRMPSQAVSFRDVCRSRSRSRSGSTCRRCHQPASASATDAALVKDRFVRHSRNLLQGCQRIRTRRSRLVRCTRHRRRVLRHMGRRRRRCRRRPHRPHTGVDRPDALAECLSSWSCHRSRSLRHGMSSPHHRCRTRHRTLSSQSSDRCYNTGMSAHPPHS